MKIKKTGWLWRVAYGWRVKCDIGKNKIPEKTDLCHFARAFLRGLFMWPTLFLIYVVLGSGLHFVLFCFGGRPDLEGPDIYKPIWMPRIRGVRIVPVYLMVAAWVLFSLRQTKQIVQGPILTDITSNQVLQVITTMVFGLLCVCGLAFKLAPPAFRLVDRAMKHVPFPACSLELPRLPKLARPKTPEWWTVAKAYGKSFKDKTCVLVTFE